MSRSRWLAALALSAGALVSAAPAQAGTAATREPIFAIGGAQMDCSNNSGTAPGLAEVMQDPPAISDAWGPTEQRPVPWLPVQALEPDMITSWQNGGANGYDQCNPYVTFNTLAQRLKNRLTEWKASLNAAGRNVTKIDIVANSLGSTISRYCIQVITGCAELVDDWVGITPPSHGTYYGPLYYLNCTSVPYRAACEASKPTGNVMKLTNGTNPGGSGDETPKGSNDPGGWIEYTTIRAVNDGLIMGPGPAFAGGTERLIGAANWRSVTPGGADTTHANWAGPQPACAASTRYSQNGITEAVAAEIADVTDRSTWNLSTATSFDNDLLCTTNLIDI